MIELDNGRIKLYCGDSNDIIPTLKINPKDINLMLTDPPYNIGYKYNSYKDNLSWKEYYDWQFNALKEVKRVLKKDGSILWLNYPEQAAIIWARLMSVYKPVKWINWIYHQHTGGKPLRKASRAWLWMSKNDFPYMGDDALRGEYQNPTDKRVRERIKLGLKPIDYDWWEYDDTWMCEQVKNVNKDKTEHPCQLPIEMIARLVSAACPEGGKVLDIYMGSGTTGVACAQSGRAFIGIEKDEKYFEIALNRIKKALEEPKPEKILPQPEKFLQADLTESVFMVEC